MEWEITTKQVSDLKEWKNNPRKLTKSGLKQLQESIKRFGVAEPIVINRDNTICGGHGRKKALQELGVTEVNCYMPEKKLTPKQFEELNIRLNKNIAGEWDVDSLKNNFSFEDLQDWGFKKNELPRFDDIGDAEEDDLPEPVVAPVTRPRMVWVLGDHTLVCGDSTDPDVVRPEMAKFKPNLMVTDPPYGVNYDPSWREGAKLGVGEHSKGKVLNDGRADWGEAWELFTGRIAYVWHGGLHSSEVTHSLEAMDFKIRAQIIWVKQHFVMSRGDYHWQHESCWYAVRKKGNWSGDRKQTTVWEIKNNNSFGNAKKEETYGHGAQKPVECMRRPMQNNSDIGDTVYDPFCGSGSTIIAAEQTGRKCLAIELNPVYVDMAIQRWQNYTNKRAILRSTGQTYDEIAHDKENNSSKTKKPR